MREFTSHYNDKEITFTEEGIRYNNEIYIKYRDMRDISHRTEGSASIVFRYKDRLVRMRYNPEDKPEIMPYLALAMQISKEAEKEEAMSPVKMAEDSATLPNSIGELEKFSYLDNYQQPAQAPVEEKPKKKKTGLIIAAVVLVIAVVAAALVILL